MRISDWSSDVCSSDLPLAHQGSALTDHTLCQLGVPLVRRDPALTRDLIEGDALEEVHAPLRACLAHEHERRGYEGVGGLLDLVKTALGASRLGDRKSTRLNYSHSCASRMPPSS